MEPQKGFDDLRKDFEARLEKVQDRVLTAVFGFVNGASARMERLETEDNTSKAEIARLERRLRALERRGLKPGRQTK